MKLAWFGLVIIKAVKDEVKNRLNSQKRKTLRRAIHRNLPWAFVLFPLFLTGCFETEFNFQTTIFPDESIRRETRIDGRGAKFFKPPAGPGWKVRAWQTKGPSLLVPETIDHLVAEGSFGPHQPIPSDYHYQFQEEKNLSPDELQRLEQAQIPKPYSDHIFCRNQIRIQQASTWFYQTFLYEEVFQNEGILEVLLLDLKENIRREASQHGESFGDSELAVMARLRLEDEILPAIHFRSAVSLPGRVVSSNANSRQAGKLVWEFSLKDFQKNYSVTTLRAVSRSLRWPAVLLLCLIFLLVVVLVFLSAKAMRKRGEKPKKIEEPESSEGHKPNKKGRPKKGP